MNRPGFLFRMAAAGIAHAIVFAASVCSAEVRLVSPLRHTPAPGLYPNFLWESDSAAKADQAPRYQFQLAITKDFAAPLVDTVSPVARYVPAGLRLQPGASYCWRVRQVDGPAGAAAWSQTGAFTVADFTRTVIEVDARAGVAGLRAAFAKAKARAPATVRLVADLSLGAKGDDSVVSLDRCRDVWFDGNGKTITVTDPSNRLFHALDCSNLVFSDFSVDYRPLPYVLCEVTAVDAAANRFTVRTISDAANPCLELDDPRMLGAQKTHMRLLDRAHPGRIKPGTDTYIHDGRQTYVRSYEQGGVRYHVIQLNPKTDTTDGFAVGDTMLRVARGDSRNILRAVRSTDLCIDGATVSASPAQFANSVDGSGLIVINSRVTLPPGRYCSINADCVYVRRNRIGPWVENCTFTGNGDDCFNLHATANFIASAAGDRVVRLKTPADFNLYAVGDEVTLWAATPQAPPPVYTRVVAMDRPSLSLTLADPTGRLLAGSDGGKGGGATGLYNRSRSNARFCLRNNRIVDNARFGLLLSSSDGIVTGNTFAGCASSSIQIGNDPPEGLNATHLLFTGNRILDCGYSRTYRRDQGGAISVTAFATGWRPVAHRLHHDLVFRDNEIAGWSGAAVRLAGVDRIGLYGTQIGAIASPPDGLPALRHDLFIVEQADAVTIKDTRIDRRLATDAPLRRGDAVTGLLFEPPSPASEP